MVTEKIVNLTLSEHEASSVFLVLKRGEEHLDEYSHSVLVRLETFLYTSMSIEVLEKLIATMESKNSVH
jgi:hypothetical protein